MQAENKDDINIQQESKNQTPQKEPNRDFTFAKSPIKTPRSIGKYNNQIIKSQILRKFQEKEDKNDQSKAEKREQIQSEGMIHRDQRRRNSTKKEETEIEISISNMNKPRGLAPKATAEESEIKEGTVTDMEENNLDSLSYRKKKKDWKSWSSQEKELFYEAIANGGNYSSLQKLFKNMNNKIGTKSTEKIRDYYYRALKNVNKLLRSVGDSGINRKNRDEVLLALNCYGKMITSSNSKQKSKLDAMKKLNKHPRLFKKTALSLKKLIMRGVKSMRTRKICNTSSTHNRDKNQHKSKQISKNVTFKKDYKIYNNTMNNVFPNVKIIDPDLARRIPFEKFSLKLTPYDQETYFKMIECNYSSRFEISIAYNKSLKQLIEILQEKWKNVMKKYKNSALYLCPIEDIWIPSEITFFSANENTKAYDVGDIYTAYGRPSTNEILLQYQWNDSNAHLKHYTNKDNSVCQSGGNVNSLINNSNLENNQPNNPNNVSNSLLAQPTINLDASPKNNSRLKVEDLLNSNSGNSSEEDKEKSFIPLEQEYDEFDPLEFLGIYQSKDTKKNKSSDGDGDIDEDLEFNFDENNCKMWEEDDLYGIDDLKNLSPCDSNSQLNIHHIGKVKIDGIIEDPIQEKNPSKVEKPIKNPFDLNKSMSQSPSNDNMAFQSLRPRDPDTISEENDPYKRLDFFNKIKTKSNPDLLNNSNNDSAIAAVTSNFMKTNKSNVFTVSECNSNLEGGSNVNSKGFLNFQDLNSKIKSNSLTLSAQPNNQDKIISDSRTFSFNNEGERSSAEQKIGNTVGSTQENIEKNKTNTNAQSRMNMPKMMTRGAKKRIPFINNNTTENVTLIKQNSTIDNNILEKEAPNESIELNKPEEAVDIIQNVSPKEVSNSNPHYTPFITNSLNRNKLSYNNENSNLFSRDNKQITTFNDKKDDVSNFNPGENSNLNFFGYSHNPMGIFEDSNLMLRNNYNNSMFFGADMFNSNHLNSIFTKNVEDTMLRKVTNVQDKEGNSGNINTQYKNPVSDFKDKIYNLPLENKEVKEEKKAMSIILSSDVSNEYPQDDSVLKKKKKRESEKKDKAQNEGKKKKRTSPVKLDDILEGQNGKEGKDKKTKPKKGEKSKNQSIIGSSIISNKVNNKNPTQNIQISNTNPYIINQNNYFNGYGSSLPPMDQHGHQRFIYPPPQLHPFAVDIPHPNNFMGTVPRNNLNQFIPGGMNPLNDPNLIWTYQPINRFPPASLYPSHQNSQSQRSQLYPVIGDYYPPNAKYQAQKKEKKSK